MSDGSAIPWSEEDRQRKRRIIGNLFRSLLVWIEDAHPDTGRACGRREAISFLETMQAGVLAKLAESYGTDIVQRYQVLIDEVLREMSHASDN